ncbi:hypothetical protein [Sphingomonas soli]|uniref:hypothetical protein n=1 Tax=Sphingomonas soli TaxID=266127 RepID=UPI00082C0DD4|nr:hypothetical protein [Sphingomonas soli]
MIDHYDWEGGREAMLRFGPSTGPVIVAALPLFEEANRTRTFAVTILRALAERGIASALPDLPGQGESLMPTSPSILTLQDAFQAACATFDRAGRNCYAMGIRSGALLDTYAIAYGRWHFAPVDGAQVLRELTRVKQVEVGSSRKLGELWYFDGEEDALVEIAGNLISPDLLTDLKVKSAFSIEDAPDIPLRTVRHETDAKAADLKVPGAPLWRRAEPDNDPALAARLADDIADWIRACEG